MLNKRRRRSQGGSSSYGELFHDQVVLEDGLCRNARDVVPCERSTHQLLKYYRDKAYLRRPPHDLAVCPRCS